jgi:N-acetylglucosaminyldiphosphoundecaprenol N-acetyl-beta-D-mannosaminyltransferase
MMASVVPSVAARDCVEILGLPVDRVSMDSAMEIIQRFLKEDRPHMVVTADAAGMVQTGDNPDLREIFKSADLVTPDSVGILWAARRRRKPIAGRVSGVDMVEKLAQLSANAGHRIFLLGSAPGVAELAAEKLRLKYPGCNIVGTRHGFFPSDSDTLVAQEIATFRPDILLVAMGIPRQERFIRATQSIIKAKVAMGVGGSLDVFSGKARRAPGIIQRMHLEWLWRTLLNPSKFRKAKYLPVFVWRVLRSRP